jgi:hypothetical protein
MKAVYKYELDSQNPVIQVPNGISVCWQPIHVGLDPRGKACVWIMVDPTAPTKPVRFFIVGTGDEIPDDAELYVGTFNQGPFVWHIFVELP